MQNDDLIGKTLHDSYAITSLLGEGGMGRVYLAHNVRISDKKYAIKVLKKGLTIDPKFEQQFKEEATHQGKLSHPNIIEMYDYLEEGEHTFLILPYIDGQSVAEIIDELQGQPMPEKQVLHIFKGVLAGLNCAHEQAILHRDIKASNVMVDNSGRPLILDFGIAQQAGDKQAASLGRSIGTPEYMSPEQFVDSDKIDHRSDVYSAGILLFEMLTGKLPFHGTFEDLKENRLPVPDPRKFNPKIKKELAKIVLKATQRDPKARFQGCLDFLKAIESYEHVRYWKILGFSLSILVIAGTWVYLQNLQTMRTEVALATDNYAFLCRETETLKRKETALRVATETGNSEMVEAFSKHIKDHNANIERFFGDYTKSLHDLHERAKFNPGGPKKVFGETEHIDGAKQVRYEQADELRRKKFRELAGDDFERFSNTGEDSSKETMLARCPS